MKILMICNTDGALYVFRQPLIKQLLANDHVVSSITSEGRYIEKLSSLGVEADVLDFDNHSTSILKNLRILWKLIAMVKAKQPDIIHSFTHKPAIFGTIAARILKVRRIFVTITGLGTVFTYNDIKSSIVRFFLILQYKVALRFATCVFFQNPDDMRYFIDKKILPEHKAVLTNGSGVDLIDFPLPITVDSKPAREMLAREIKEDLEGKIVILFPARALKEKGFYEFYTAARKIRQLAGNYIFIHLGLVDTHSKYRVTKDNIDKFARECGVYYLGFKDNIKDYMTAADIVILPSYREGVPRSLIEALALDKFVITNDVAGCRETVIDGWNGFLCKAGDCNDLISKILKVEIKTLELFKGRSRKYCEMKFDAAQLVKTTFKVYFE